jgi:prepilin-type N-terminal cleavage/methylation domain-containing protein
MIRIRRSGFTLVELLVVIGIIAVLMSLLVPALSSARAAANKINCSSRLRQIGQWVAMYAGSQRGFVPVGWLSNDSYSPGTSTIWYMQKSSFTNGPVGLGCLFSAGIAKSNSQQTRQAWYCPSMPAEWRFSLDKTTNRWVDMPISDADALAYPFGGSISLKMGYSSRSALTSDPNDNQTLRWTAGTGNASVWNRPVYTGTFAGANAVLRSGAALKSKAIVADMLGDPRLVNGVHKTGVNVLYANYGVKWIPIEMFKADLTLTNITPSPVGNYTAGGGGSSSALHRTWETFDRQ